MLRAFNVADENSHAVLHFNELLPENLLIHQFSLVFLSLFSLSLSLSLSSSTCSENINVCVSSHLMNSEIKVEDSKLSPVLRYLFII